MQTPTRMDNVVIKDYYHMITMNENVNWMELTHMLLSFPLNPKARFCTSTFTSTFLIAFFYMYKLEKNNTSPLCIICMLMPQILPLLTLTLVHTWYEEATLGLYP